MLGKELAPYASTTALALLALQDRLSLPEVDRSTAWLTGNWPQERSALALALSLIAMDVLGRASGEIERTIRAHVVDAGPPQNVFLTALMLYALTGPRHGYAALKV